MSTFDKVIGYESIKNELLQICDMIHNPQIYTALGAQMPQGLLLYGEPGLGKTLMAKCFIDECGLTTYTIRRSKATTAFVEEISSTFRTAKENAPAIVFLDDMDKFANEDEHHRDAEEYVAVQSGMDEVKGSGVFVLATANEIYKLPRSLKRSGRFDHKIEVCRPSPKDACEIIKHYLKNKKVSADVDMEDIAMMVNYSSCAELETLLNKAAIRAGFMRKDQIEMDDFIHAVLSTKYEAPDDCTTISKEKQHKIALHEAGHLVVCEALQSGSVGLASVRSDTGGFIRRCKELPQRSHQVLVSLAGKAAVELYYSDSYTEGCHEDIERAFNKIRTDISESGACGFGMVDVATHRFPDTSESMNARNEAVVQAALERAMVKTRNILLKNRDFLESAAQLLLEKGTLLHSDIRALRESVSVVEVAV